MNIVDLFSGAGGLTFGFYYSLVKGSFQKNTSNHFLFANEIDEDACNAFRKNFPDIPLIQKDIKMLSESDIRPFLKGEEVDVIIGGPPCQSYSTIGKRRFDDKAKLYQEYIRLLRILKPEMFVFENVKGILSMKNGHGNLVIDTIKKRFGYLEKGLGYSLDLKVLDAADFGVPQHRERLVIVGKKKGSNLVYLFPRKLSSPKITLEEAISDLPPISQGEEATSYSDSTTSDYQDLMRSGSKGLTLHASRIHGDKINTVIRNVKPGQGKEDFNHLIDEGKILEKYRLTSGYKNTYGRLEGNKPCTTITDNFCTPSSLRCIHYAQDRTLTIREGARIQSFPDWYFFCGSDGSIKKQIGNAVPPLLALALGQSIEKTVLKKNG